MVKLSDMDLMHGFAVPSKSVYVMTVNGLSCKIGYSGNVGGRCSTLNVGSVDNINIFWAVRLIAREACKLESMCHRELKKHGLHLRGEWFCIHPQAAVGVVQRLAKEAKFRLVPDLLFGYDR